MDELFCLNGDVLIAFLFYVGYPLEQRGERKL